MPPTPDVASFLSANEKAYVGHVLRQDGAVARDERDDSFDWTQVRKTFRAPQVILVGIAGFFNGVFCLSFRIRNKRADARLCLQAQRCSDLHSMS